MAFHHLIYTYTNTRTKTKINTYSATSCKTAKNKSSVSCKGPRAH
jgi:hypothetical protein